MQRNKIKDEAIKKYTFLSEMYSDAYFPNFLVDKLKNILLELCYNMEIKTPKNLAELYLLTHFSTEKINLLQEEFYENESEIETAARDTIGSDFEFIAKTYGFEEADIEELIAPRDW